MKATRRRDPGGLSLSFLDVISCGFGALVLLLVLTKVAEPVILKESTAGLSDRIEALQARLAALGSETEVLNQELTAREEELAEAQGEHARLQGELSDMEGEFQASTQDSQVTKIIQGRLASAKQALSEEMKRLQATPYQRKDSTVGGIPVDSEYIIFVIDTSGSMYDYGWSMVLKKVSETLQVYPRVKGIQVMNDMGTYMFSQYAGQWIPDTPARREAITRRLRTWNPFSNSSPVEGITEAIQTFYAADKRISLYVFGDEFTGGSIEAVVRAVDRINRPDAKGKRRVRIHAVGFPVQFARPPHLQTTGVRFAILMRTLAHKNGGTFVGLSSF